MKSILKNAADTKAVSCFSCALLLFTYLADARRYLYDNIYTAFDLGNLGAFGARLSVSVLLPVLMAFGVAVGAALAFAVRRRAARSLPVVLYTLSALFVVVFLFFTPYNLQLLLPSQIGQNLAMIGCIAVLVFCAVDTAVFSLSLLVHRQLLGRSAGRHGGVLVLLLLGLAAAGALALTFCHAPFGVCTAVFAGVLLFANILDAAFARPAFAGAKPCPARLRTAGGAAFGVLSATVLLAGALWTEQAIAF